MDTKLQKATHKANLSRSKADSLLENQEKHEAQVKERKFKILARDEMRAKIAKETHNRMRIYEALAEKLGVSWFDIENFIHDWKEIQRELSEAKPEVELDWWDEIGEWVQE